MQKTILQREFPRAARIALVVARVKVIMKKTKTTKLPRWVLVRFSQSHQNAVKKTKFAIIKFVHQDPISSDMGKIVLISMIVISMFSNGDNIALALTFLDKLDKASEGRCHSEFGLLQPTV